MSAVESVTQIQAYAIINNQATPMPLETFDVQLAAYGSVGHFECTTAISGLATHGFDANNLLGVEIENAQPSLSDGSPSYPIQLYATGAYSGVTAQIFGGDIDELSWDFDRDELKITGRDFGGRMRDWVAVITATPGQGSQLYTNMDYAQFATAIIKGVGLIPQISDSSTVNKPLYQLLFSIGANAPGTTRFGYDAVGLSDNVSIYAAPQNTWDLLNKIARSIGFIVTVHFDGTVYVGPPGGDSAINLSPRTFTWMAEEGTPNTIPVRNLTIDHGPRQYGTFVVNAYGYHSPSAQISVAHGMGLAGNTTYFGLARQPLTTGVYASKPPTSAVQAGKPNYFFYVPGMTLPQVEQKQLAATFDIAKRLYVVHGEIDGDPTLVPTTPMALAEAQSGALQGYAGKPLDIASVNHTFSMEDGFNTLFKAWHAPKVNGAVETA